MKAPRLFQRLTKMAVIPPLLIILTVVLPLVSSLVTYAFVSLPDNSISLDLTGSLLLLLVLFKILILGSLGTFPIDLNAFFQKRKGRRAARHLMDGVNAATRYSPTRDYLMAGRKSVVFDKKENAHWAFVQAFENEGETINLYVAQRKEELSRYGRALVDDLPCTVRILCELETAARTAMEAPMDDIEALHEGSVDDRGQTLEDGDRVEGTLLDIDHIGLYQEAAVLALFGNDSSTTNSKPTPNFILTSRRNDLGPGSLLALSHLDGMTGSRQCEIAYTRCPGDISPKDAIGVLLRDFDVRIPNRGI
ncbi:uncharacterized protein [Macrobrachium rosenbergii]|uniref:uncharacterized protein n=1 Tax=Macrobrachium rosenbergii TaxID=79674 RepID=UPI0034D4F563